MNSPPRPLRVRPSQGEGGVGAITLLIPGLTGGGAEKVIVRLANHWAAEGWQVTVITLSGTADDVYSPDKRVQRIALDMQSDSRGMLSAIANNRRRIKALREAILRSEPAAVISFTEQMNILARLATKGRRFPLIISERVDPRHHDLGRIWNFLRRKSYRFVDRIVVQTQAVKEYVGKFSGNVPIEVIPNGVETPTVDLASMPNRRKVIVAAGRLTQQKGFDLLLDAFAPIAAKYADWSLEIYGTGPLEQALHTRIHDHKLENRVTLAGWTADFASVVANSSIFVLSSRYEGFPNALLDAMAHGAACVSFACPSGPEEIIRDRVDGILVPPENVSQLSDTIEELIQDHSLRAELGNSAREIVNRYGIDKFLARWDQLLAEATR